MKNLFAFIITIAALNLSAQTMISQFTFNSNPVTQAAVGPSATSVSSSATSSAGGVQGNGLNPKGTGEKQDVNMVVPGSPTFDVNGIDISVSYRRNESDAYFFTRGSSMNFGMGGGSLLVTYRVRTGNSSYETISSGGVYTIPSDDTYRTYRFVYNPASGRGTLQVNGVVVWTNQGTSGRNLYWTGAGDVVIGQLMDGNGNSKTVLDNFTTYSVTNGALPIELMSFDANLDDTERPIVNLNWSTASERNNAYFSVEKSADGISWEEIKRVSGAGNSAIRLDYATSDADPKTGTSYYRLKQTDYNGEFEIFHVVSVEIKSSALEASVYPNPTNGAFVVAAAQMETALNNEIRVFNAMGTIVAEIQDTHVSKTSIDITDLVSGTYIVEVTCDGQVSRSMILKN